MIFLFFGSSIARLEPELERFNLQPIFFSIWEIRCLAQGSQQEADYDCNHFDCWLPWARQQISQSLKNSDWSLKLYNLGSRWAIEEPKKRKIIRILRRKCWSNQFKSSGKHITTGRPCSNLKICKNFGSKFHNANWSVHRQNLQWTWPGSGQTR